MASASVSAEDMEHKFWKSKDNHCIATIWDNDLDNPKGWRDDVYLSSDCGNFSPLVRSKRGLTTLDGKEVWYQKLVDPYKNDELVMWYDYGNRLVLPDGKTFDPASLDPRGMTFRSLPETRVPVHVLQLADGSDFYVYVDDYKYHRPFSYYKNYRLFAGPRNDMRQILVKDVAYYFDGDTTFVWAGSDVLFVPAKGYENQPWHVFPRGEKSPVPLWNKKSLRRLDPRDFSIEEKGDKAILKKRE
jgi:hypothetical protein